MNRLCRSSSPDDIPLIFQVEDLQVFYAAMHLTDPPSSGCISIRRVAEIIPGITEYERGSDASSVPRACFGSVTIK